MSCLAISTNSIESKRPRVPIEWSSVFSPDDLWIDLDTYTNCTFIYDLVLKLWLMGCANCIYLCWLMGKGVAYGGLPFPATGCPVPDGGSIYLIWNI